MPNAAAQFGMGDALTRDLFGTSAESAGALGCGIEIAATLNEALAKAHVAGISRSEVARRMSHHLGEAVSEANLGDWCSPSHRYPISLLRSLAFDAALGQDVLLGLFARKRERRVVSIAEAHFAELGRLREERRRLAEREKLLELTLRTGRGNA